MTVLFSKDIRHCIVDIFINNYKLIIIIYNLLIINYNNKRKLQPAINRLIIK